MQDYCERDVEATSPVGVSPTRSNSPSSSSIDCRTLPPLRQDGRSTRRVQKHCPSTSHHNAPTSKLNSRRSSRTGRSRSSSRKSTTCCCQRRTLHQAQGNPVQPEQPEACRVLLRQKYDWKPEKFTCKVTPRSTRRHWDTAGPEAQKLARSVMLQKRLGQCQMGRTPRASSMTTVNSGTRSTRTALSQ